MIEYCVCGHLKEAHFIRLNNSMTTPMLCASIVDKCMNFKLDNLKFIEDLAKEKGLM